MTKEYGLDALDKKLKNQNRKSISRNIQKGESIIVRIPDAATCADTYLAHNFYIKGSKNSVLPFACVKEEDVFASDPFDKASDYLLAIAESRRDSGKYSRENPDPCYVMGKKLKASIRCQFGFFDLADGQPFILEVGQKHGEKIKEILKKKGEEIKKFPFEITKIGSDSSSDYTIDVYLKDLTKEQQANFEATNIPFDTSLYAESVYLKTAEQQVQMLANIGFDVTKIGYPAPSNMVNMAKQTPTVTEEAPKVEPESPSFAKEENINASLPEEWATNTKEINEMFDDEETA